MSLKRGLILSLLAHLLFAVPFIIPGCGSGEDNSKGKHKGSQEEQEILERAKKEHAKKNEPIEVSLINLPKPPKTPHSDQDCPGKFYGGVGIYTGYVNGHYYITKAVKGYPAELAGFQRGDEILSPDQSQIRGEVGTPVTITVSSMVGFVLTATLIRDKICLEDKKP